MIRITSSIGGALLGCVLVGCDGPSEKMEPVEGSIRFEGKALTKGTVIFKPDTAKGNTTPHEPRGVIHGSGRYKMTTHPRDGAPTGWYNVAVISLEQPKDPSNPYARPKSLIPDRFGNVEESGLSIEVRKNAPLGAYDLELK
jgi:hypothetical protein